jgi:mono/diheme cytochrome c family protein
MQVTRNFTASLVVCALLSAAVSGPAAEPNREAGTRLAAQHCASCHQVPSPDLLTKRSWEFCLTYMGFFLGVDDPSALAGSPAEVMEIIHARREFVGTAGLFPPQSRITSDDWATLRHYFIDQAPVAPIPPTDKSRPIENTTWFTPHPHRYERPQALTSLVKIDESRNQIMLHDGLAEKLTILDRDGDLIAEHEAPGVALVDAQFVDHAVYLLNIGDLFASQIGEGHGELQSARITGGLFYGLKVLLTGLHRPCDLKFADLDADGTLDAVISNFGDFTGNLSVHYGEPTAAVFSSHPKILSNQPGIVETQPHDFNGDGLLDLAVLTSAGAENLSILINQGDRTFEPHLIVAQPPTFGYTRLELRDFNGDGRMDIVTANGDNGDSDPYNTLKRDHGIRIYLNQGNLKFELATFYPMYGVFGIEIEDFDLDGDLDIAAIAFHPDFGPENRENFVLLEQTSPMTFSPQTHPATYAGRWMTMDSGDLDGDGDLDLVLGAGYSPVGLRFDHPERLHQMMTTGPALIILENQTRP